MQPTTRAPAGPLTRNAGAAILAAMLLLASCTRTPAPSGEPDAAPGPRCNNGSCELGESCTSCPADCGACGACGDKTCQPNESCRDCPADCGRCASCGDGTCEAELDEDCRSCAADCGTCVDCGDGTCQPEQESCLLCPLDCGLCSGCPNGRCEAPEDCASCPFDCGRCTLCGDGECQSDRFESCVDCPEDCGECEVLRCWEVLLCATECFDFDSFPPRVDPPCAASCLIDACDDARALINRFFRCAIGTLPACRDAECLFENCETDSQECFRSSC